MIISGYEIMGKMFSFMIFYIFQIFCNAGLCLFVTIHGLPSSPLLFLFYSVALQRYVASLSLGFLVREMSIIKALTLDCFCEDDQNRGTCMESC